MVLQKLCDTYSEDASISDAIGRFFQSRKMPVKAEFYYLKSLEIDEDQPAIYYNLGLIYQTLNKTDFAIDAYNRAVDLNPQHVKAHANLGYIYHQKGLTDKCKKSFNIAAGIDPENAQLKHMMASLGLVDIPKTADAEYVKNTFDSYADHYDEHLLQKLKTRTPQLVIDDVIKFFQPQHYNKPSLLDLGCGTGLCGEDLHNYFETLVGVDLSPKMIEIADSKNIYNSTYIDDITGFLQKDNEKYDVIIASDVFVYIGDLKPVFTLIHQHLKYNGIFSFTTETLLDAEKQYILCETGRYKHNIDHIKSLIESCQFEALSMRNEPIRTHNGEFIEGNIYTIQKLAL